MPVNGVLFLSTSGWDANPGTQAQPMRTVSAAVAKVGASSPPFAVDVAGGTYDEGAGFTVTSGITVGAGFDPSTSAEPGAQTTIITGGPQAANASDATGAGLPRWPGAPLPVTRIRWQSLMPGGKIRQDRARFRAQLLLRPRPARTRRSDRAFHYPSWRREELLTYPGRLSACIES